MGRIAQQLRIPAIELRQKSAREARGLGRRGEPIVNPLPLRLPLDEPGLAEDLQVTRYARFGSELLHGGAHFDALLLDHPADSGEALGQMLAQARGLLVLKGRLWMFEPYDSLEGSRGRVIEHPLARLRRLLEGAGLHCERLSPIEADGEHVLAAFARPLAEGPVLTTHAEGAA